MRKCYLGIDSGGSKTICLASNEKGEIISIGHGASGASLRPEGLSERSIIPAVRSAMLSLPEKTEPTGIFVSLGGLNLLEVKTSLTAAFPGTFIDVESESSGGILMDAAKYWNFDMAIMAGTGSVGIGIDKSNNKIISIGGWGHLIDDKGSGYAIGRGAFRLVADYFDGAGGPTLLAYEMAASDISDGTFPSKALAILETAPVKLTMSERNLLRSCLKNLCGKLDREKIASFCRFAAKTASLGDCLAMELMKRAAKDLVSIVVTLANLSNSDSPNIQCMGGVFKIEILIEEFKKELQRCIPKARVNSGFFLAQGALLRSLRNGGGKITSEVIENLKNSKEEFYECCK